MELAEPLPIEKPDPPPLRLSILHYLFWMAGIAVLLAVRRKESYTLPDWPVWEVWLVHGIQFFGTALAGISLASLALLAQHGFRRPVRFPREPGHWLLIASGFMNVMLIPFLVFAQWQQSDEPQSSWKLEFLLTYFCLGIAACSLVWGVVLLLAAWRLPRGPWPVVLGIGGVGAVLQAALSIVVLGGLHWLDHPSQPTYWPIGWLSGLSFGVELTYLLFVTLTFIPLLWEWKRRRDFLHWVGLGVLYLSAAQELVLFVWRLVRPFIM